MAHFEELCFEVDIFIIGILHVKQNMQKKGINCIKNKLTNVNVYRKRLLLQITAKTEIANGFNDFFVNVGLNLTRKIRSNNIYFDTAYLKIVSVVFTIKN